MIKVREGRRPINPEGVARIVKSMQDHKPFAPIGVNHKTAENEYWLTYGNHRLEAHKDSGLTQIKANVYKAT